MHKLRPTLWRTCRVLANEKRLQLLYALFEKGEQCVFELAGEVSISEAHASIHLRALNSRGLIRQRRSKMRVLYSTEANIEVASAKPLLEALHICHSQNIPTRFLLKQATAFTHPRRIEIIQNIPPSGIAKDLLKEKTCISFSALSRHLGKLTTRGFVRGGKNIYFKKMPPDALSKALMQLVAKTE